MSNLLETMARLVNASQQQAIATLAAAIITARGKPVSINDTLAIAHDIHMAMFLPRTTGMYKEWAQTKDQRLSKVYD